MPADLRDSIQSSLAAFADKPLRTAATGLFRTLGYDSDRKLDWTLDTFLDLTSKSINPLSDKEITLLRADVTHFDLLFQLTDSEITDSSHVDLFESRTAVDTTKIFSYLVIACELKRERYNRTDLARLARLINKPLPMPALVLFKHGDTISLAILHRRLNKRQAEKDVLEKATLIKDIRFVEPIRAHLEILQDFSLSHLAEEFGFHNFVSLHEAWRKRLDTFALNDKFYQEIADWYFWAQHLIAEGKIIPPRDADTEAERSLFLIRLLTRLIFCWFLLEKRLLPPALFRDKDLRKLLKDFSPDSPSYYKAVLQNLFFATLNQPQTDRSFRGKSTAGGFDANRGATNLWRYENYFSESTKWPAMVKTVPFLNGGLFDCLDHVYQKVEKQNNTRLDDFSEEKANTLHLPNDLFFGPERTVDLSADYGEEDKRTARSKKAKVRGLIEILSRYKFTIEENTPLDEEIALDPELLGKVFENLLASYNEETRTTARKATGSFYTPREVVSYMVDEALIAYLEPLLTAKDKQTKIRTLFDSRLEDFHTPFTPDETTQLITALDSVKIFDPACGSGAFPMGSLNRLVDLLAKLDPTNRLWIALQISKAKNAEGRTDAERKEEVTMWSSFTDNDRFEADYVRKLALIEQSIFGADIQPVAVQIAKLRFFISLICDQKTDPHSENSGILPLPNLETRIVAANTLIPIQGAVTGAVTQADLMDYQIDALREELRRVRHDHFQARNPAKKKKCRDRDKELRDQIAAALKSNGLPTETAARLAAWDPYDQNEAAPFFDPVWMFGTAYTRPSTITGNFADIINSVQNQLANTLSKKEGPLASDESGFDVIIANPPYLKERDSKKLREELNRSDWAIGYRESKMDLWYYFLHRSIELCSQRGSIAFITSRYWIESQGSRKLIEHLRQAMTPFVFVDIGALQLFDNVVGHHLVHIYRRGNYDTSAEVRTLIDTVVDIGSRVQTPNLRIIKRRSSDLFPRSGGVKLYADKLNLNAPQVIGDSFFVSQGLVENPDRTNSKHKVKFGVAEDKPVFMLKAEEVDEASFSPTEMTFLKPFYYASDIQRYFAENTPNYYVLYLNRDNCPSIDDLPVIKRHLLPFKKIMESRRETINGSNQWFHLHWPRQQSYFEGPHILIPSMFKEPIAGLYLKPAYTGISCNIITSSDSSDLEQLVAILNSPLASFWFHQSGKKRGVGVDIGVAALRQFPWPKIVDKSHRILISRLLIMVSCQPQGLNSFPRDPQMVEFYRRLLNGLVYELYLPEELHDAGLFLFDLVEHAHLPDLDALPAAKSESKQKLRLLREKFEELADLRHPLRAALQKLSTLDSVRIIEGKA
jgi:adenine-specific DNA-methyltransferase